MNDDNYDSEDDNAGSNDEKSKENFPSIQHYAKRPPQIISLRFYYPERVF